MLELIKKLINKFFTKSFIAFAIIGVINTIINTICYSTSKNIFDNILPGLSVLLSTAIAFIIASIFSYFANAKFSFNVKNKSNEQFIIVMLTFLVRLLLTMALTYVFDILFKNMVNETLYAKYDFMPNLVASVLMIPIFYIVLEYVFKKTDKVK